MANANAKARASQCSCYKEALRGERPWAGPGQQGAKATKQRKHIFAHLCSINSAKSKTCSNPFPSISMTCLILTGVRRIIKVSLLKYADFTFSRMRSKGSRFTLGVWRGLGVEGVFARRCPTVRGRPQPSATVRMRAVWPCLW